MEEIQQLLAVFSKLPSIALWALVVLYVYKVAVVGSIYATIRFVTQKLHDMYVNKTVSFKLHDRLTGITISGENNLEELIAQVQRVAGKNTGIHSRYIHNQSVQWLREAINDKEEKDRVAEETKSSIKKMSLALEK
jgi:hypothetical protein